MKSLLKITNNAQEFKNEDRCVVYFTAQWCNPCKQLKPHYGRAAVMNPELNYYLVDVDDVGAEHLEYYSIKSIPQVFVMEKGEIIKKIDAKTAEEILREIIE